MTSDGMDGGGSAKSDFIYKGALTKHLMTVEGGQKGWKSSDVIYGSPLVMIKIVFFGGEKFSKVPLGFKQMNVSTLWYSIGEFFNEQTL